MTEEKWEKIIKIIKWIEFFGWGGLGIFAVVTKTEHPWQTMYAISCFFLMLLHIK